MIASLHFHRVHGVGIARSVAHMAIDRRSLSSVQGLRFWKLLGTGSSDTFALRDADPTVWGMFGVWDSPESLHRFLETCRVTKSWSKRSDEQWSAELHPIRSKGTWGGRDPFAGLQGNEHETLVAANPVAVLTRARVRPAQWRAFANAVPPVAAAVNEASGLRFSVGIGEAPIGLQATFSIWNSANEIDMFAYKNSAHRNVIRRTSTSNWYAEELFARFWVQSESGIIRGVTC